MPMPSHTTNVAAPFMNLLPSDVPEDNTSIDAVVEPQDVTPTDNLENTGEENDGSFGMLDQRFEQRQREQEALESTTEGLLNNDSSAESGGMWSSFWDTITTTLFGSSDVVSEEINDITSTSPEINSSDEDLIPEETSSNSLVQRNTSPVDEPQQTWKKHKWEGKTAIDWLLNAGILLRDPENKDRNQLGSDVVSNFSTGVIDVTVSDPENPDASEAGFVTTRRKNVTATEEKFRAAIAGFFETALGKESGWDPLSTAWCAAFVNHVLTQMGADVLNPNAKSGSEGRYARVRADAYRNIGTEVTGWSDGDFSNIQEGDIVVFDWPKGDKRRRDNIGDHVTFYAGNRITSQDLSGGFVNVVGGNHGSQPQFTPEGVGISKEVSLRRNHDIYKWENVIAVRRITKDNITWELNDKLSEIDPIFQKFKPNNPTAQVPEFYQGGLANMDDQMNFAFRHGGSAETVDPVSGNDVPPGSLPAEVRDDIDAKLSEGEYVVPADVVRFFGVRFFEDLRSEAKMGLQKMEEDGRIGGEPIPMEGQDDMALNEGDMAGIENMIATGVAEGGLMDKIAYTLANDKAINERVNAKGISVGYAEGGLNIGADLSQIDSIIDKAMQNPKLMKLVSDKLGTVKSTTTANMQPQQMQNANPTQPVKKNPILANAGGLMGYANGGDVTESATGFNFTDFDANAYRESLFKMYESGGSRDVNMILVIGPDGVQMPLYWNDDMPLPEGYTLVNDPEADVASVGTGGMGTGGGGGADRFDGAAIGESYTKPNGETATRMPDSFYASGGDQEQNAFAAANLASASTTPTVSTGSKPVKLFTSYSDKTDQELADSLTANSRLRSGFQGMLLSPAFPFAVAALVGVGISNTKITNELKTRLNTVRDEKTRPANWENREASIENVLSGKNSDGSEADRRPLLSKLLRLKQSRNSEGQLNSTFGNLIHTVLDKFGTAVEVKEKEDEKNGIKPEDREILTAAEIKIQNGEELNSQQQLVVDTFVEAGVTLNTEAAGGSSGSSPSFFDIFTGRNRTDFGTNEYTGTGVGGKVTGTVAGDNQAGVISDASGFGLRASDILPGFKAAEGLGTLYANAKGEVFTRDFLGKETILKDSQGAVVKRDSDVFKNFSADITDPSSIPALNPLSLSREAYQEALDAGMNPKEPPQFGDDWIAAKIANTNAWGRRWNKNKDGTYITPPVATVAPVIQSEGGSDDGFATPLTSLRPRVRPNQEDPMPSPPTPRNKKAEDVAPYGSGSNNEFGVGTYNPQTRSGGFASGGLLSKPKKKSYANGGYVTSKETKQRTNGLASRS